MKATKKKFNKWMTALTNGDKTVNPYYVICYEYATSGKVVILMNFNLTLEKAEKYFEKFGRTTMLQDYPAWVEIKNAFEDMSFFEKNKNFEFYNNHNWH